MDVSYISIIISATSVFLGAIIFIVKRFRKCKCCCVECECKGSPESPISEIPAFNSSPV